MFTGIVQGQATLLTKVGDNLLKTFTFEFPNKALDNIKQGASIAINGTCLTVTNFDLSKNTACFDTIEETLRLTNLGELKIGHLVNFERAAKFGDEIGGHLMSGHIHSVAKIINIIKTDKNCSLFFKLNKNIQPYEFLRVHFMVEMMMQETGLIPLDADLSKVDEIYSKWLIANDFIKNAQFLDSKRFLESVIP